MLSAETVDVQPEWSDLKTGRMIQVGTAEPLQKATLICEREGDDLVIYLKRKRRGRKVLRYTPPAPVMSGELIDEGHFTECKGATEICSPWHDGEVQFDLFTVEDLRALGGGRVLTDDEVYARHVQKGWSLFRRARYTDARAHLEKARDSQPDDPWLLGIIERCLREESAKDPDLLGYLDEVIDDQLDLRPETFLGRAQRAHALNARAWEMFERDEDLDLALSLVDDALRESPYQLCAQDTRARILTALWRTDEAAQVVRFVEDTAPFFDDSADLFTGREPILPGFFKVRDKALRMFARATGLAAREIAGLAFEDVNLSEGVVTHGRGSISCGTTKLEGRALEALRAWFYLYLSWGQRVAKMKKRHLFVDDDHKALGVEAIEAIVG
jgi:tetratricopeptide (TPR) repeat protein